MSAQTHFMCQSLQRIVVVLLVLHFREPNKSQRALNASGKSCVCVYVCVWKNSAQASAIYMEYFALRVFDMLIEMPSHFRYVCSADPCLVFK